MSILVLWQYFLYLVRRNKDERIKLVLAPPNASIIKMFELLDEQGMCPPKKKDEEALRQTEKKYGPFWVLYEDYSGFFVSMSHTATREYYSQHENEECCEYEGGPYSRYIEKSEEELKNIPPQLHNTAHFEELKNLPREWRIIAGVEDEE